MVGLWTLLDLDEDQPAEISGYKVAPGIDAGESDAVS